MNVFIRAMVRIFSYGERLNVFFNSAIASLNRKFHLSPDKNILTIAVINIHYLHNIRYANYTTYYITAHKSFQKSSASFPHRIVYMRQAINHA